MVFSLNVIFLKASGSEGNKYWFVKLTLPSSLEIHYD